MIGNIFDAPARTGNAVPEYIVLHHTAGNSVLAAATVFAATGNNAHYIVDKNAGAIDSLRMSWKATDRNLINIFLFELLLVGINIRVLKIGRGFYGVQELLL